MDMFYLGDCLRGLNLNPTLKMIDRLGGAKKKGEKFIKLEEVGLGDLIDDIFSPDSTESPESSSDGNDFY